MRREIVVGNLAMAVPCCASATLAITRQMYGVAAFFVGSLIVCMWLIIGELWRGEWANNPETRKHRVLRLGCAGLQLALGGAFSLLCIRAVQQNQPYRTAFFLLVACWSLAFGLAELRKPRGKRWTMTEGFDETE